MRRLRLAGDMMSPYIPDKPMCEGETIPEQTSSEILSQITDDTETSKVTRYSKLGERK